MEISFAVQTIPIIKIKPNAHNPRQILQTGAVDALAASLHAVGQENPVKVRHLGPEEQAANPGFEYELIGGHLRLEAAKKLGWGTLYGLVLSLSPAQAELAAILDNRGKDMHWLDWYQSIERLWKSHPDPTQRVIADELGVSPMTVNRALKVTGLLTPAARELFVTQCYKTEGEEIISERTVRALTDLGDPQEVEKALKVVIDRQMTEAETQKLVKWVQAGHEPESFLLRTPSGLPGTGGFGGQVGQTGEKAAGDSSDPKAQYWAGLPGQVKVTPRGKGYRVVMDLTSDEAIPVVYGAMSNWEFLKGLTGETEDLRYRQALPQVHKDAAKVRLQEKAAQAKLEADRKAAGEAKADARQEALKTIAQARTEKIAAKQRAKAEKAKAKKPEMATPQNAPIDAQARNDNTGEKDLWARMGDVLHPKTGLTPAEIKKQAEKNLVQDAKQAVNQQIRRGFRNIFKDLF